jgi:hypothetical protein
VIEIDLADGRRVRVDGFVDGRALARVLGAMPSATASLPSDPEVAGPQG